MYRYRISYCLVASFDAVSNNIPNSCNLNVRLVFMLLWMRRQFGNLSWNIRACDVCCVCVFVTSVQHEFQFWNLNSWKFTVNNSLVQFKQCAHCVSSTLHWYTCHEYTTVVTAMHSGYLLIFRWFSQHPCMKLILFLKRNAYTFQFQQKQIKTHEHLNLSNQIFSDPIYVPMYHIPLHLR